MHSRELSEATARAERYLAAGSMDFDAVVVGAGASGGFAAELLTTAGLRVLLLDAGIPTSNSRTPLGHLAAQELALFSSRSGPLRAAFRKPLGLLGRIRQPIQSQCHAWHQNPEAYIDDIDCPFLDESDHPFHWIRCRGIGGRLAVPGHGRIYVRFSTEDFSSGDDERPAWPFPLRELDPWYAAAEKRLGMDAVEQTDAGLMTDALEAAIMRRLQDSWPNRNITLCNPVAPPDCVAAAARTGRLALRQGAIARSISVENGCATGVTWFDTATRKDCSARAKVIFICASPLESTRILLLSQDKATNSPIGWRSHALGNFLMDHVVLRAEAFGPWPAGVPARRGGEPQGILIRRFGGEDSRLSNFGVQIYAAKTAFGRLGLYLSAFHEMLPSSGNRVTIEPGRLDRWGIPVPRISYKHGPAETAGATAMHRALEEIATTLNTKIRRFTACHKAAGLALHECGTARMGDDPSHSVLDRYNECWDAKGLFVTDAASFPWQGTANPTLTVLALTARACSHAVGYLKS